MLGIKKRWLIVVLSILVLVGGCSSQETDLNNTESDLAVEVEIPSHFTNDLTQAITDEIELQEVEVIATDDSGEQEIKNKSLSAGQNNLVVNFESLDGTATYNLDVRATNEQYTIYNGQSVVNLSETDRVNLNLKLAKAEGLIVDLTSIPDDANSGTVSLIPAEKKLETEVDLEAGTAEFSEIPADSYTLTIELDNGINKTGEIDLLPGQVTYTEELDLESSNDSFGEIREIYSTPPAVPTDIAAEEESEGKVGLTWQGDSVEYEVYRSTNEDNKELVTTVDGNSYSDTTVEEGTTYYYWIKAVNEDKISSDYSSVAEITTAGESQTIDNGAVNNLRIYQVMVESFQDGDPNHDYDAGYGPSHHEGDIQGIIDALDYIKGTGANAIWLTPVFNSNTGNEDGQATGYFADNYYSIDPNFGTEEQFKELVDTAHEKGLYVFLDGVFGHHGADELEGVVDYEDQWYGNKVKYPESLDYFEDVATYWIEEYGIDGWRLDQAYQLYQDDTNYWSDIRTAVEEAAQNREDEGKEWGTLGYMVGEIWDGEKEIAETGYSQDGLESCFDFPMRYNLVQVLATQEETEQSGAYDEPASKLDEGFESHDEYPDDAKPNLMLTNHDLVRFGDLIQRAPHLEYGKDNPDYWKRHKAAVSFLTAYTGPITIYYGDEIGREVENFVEEGDSGFYDDHASRDSGKISNLTTNEKELKNYVAELMELRDNHPALWNGERTNLVAGETKYADLKEDPETGEKMVYALNTGTSQTTISIPQSKVGGTKLVDALTEEEISANDDYEIEVEGLTGRFFLVK
ncbi:MAG: alpha-amylase family glycosyl hydrolase [Bacillota bacterium]